MEMDMARGHTGYLASPLAPLSLCGTATRLREMPTLIKHTLVTQLLQPMGYSMSLVMSRVLKKKKKKQKQKREKTHKKALGSKIK